MKAETQPSSRLSTLAWPAVLIFTALTYVFLYAFIHEAGHALVGAAFGQRLLAFRVNIFTLNAFVSMQGYLTPLQRTLQSLAGHGLPFLLWIFFMLLAPRRGDLVLRLLKGVSSISMLGSTSVWVIIPLLYRRGQAPPGDDVTHVLNVSGMPPLLLAALAALALILAAALAAYKNQGALDDLRRFVQLRKQGRVDEQIAPALARSRRTLIVLGSLGTASALLLVGLQAALPGRASVGREPMPVPHGYAPAAEYDLSVASRQGEVAAEFTLSEPALAGVFVLVYDINSEMFELVLEGPDGFNQILIRGLGYASTRDSAFFEERLPAGAYRVVLTHLASPGWLEIYLGPQAP